MATTVYESEIGFAAAYNNWQQQGSRALFKSDTKLRSHFGKSNSGYERTAIYFEEPGRADGEQGDDAEENETDAEDEWEDGEKNGRKALSISLAFQSAFWATGESQMASKGVTRRKN